MNVNIIKSNYDKGLWSAVQVAVAVKKGVITQEECDWILGKEPTEPLSN